MSESSGPAWEDAKGKRHLIRQMPTSYLLNAIKMLERSAMNLHRLHGPPESSWHDYVDEVYHDLVAEARRRYLEW